MPTLTYLRLEDHELLLEAQLEYPLLPLELHQEIIRRGLVQRYIVFIDAAVRVPH